MNKQIIGNALQGAGAIALSAGLYLVKPWLGLVSIGICAAGIGFLVEREA